MALLKPPAITAVRAAALKQELDRHVQECKSIGYNPTIYQQLRINHGDQGAIIHLVNSGKIDSGFEKLWRLNRLDLTCEATVIKFKDCFDKQTITAAENLLMGAEVSTPK
ncbi:hypothetical protein FACS1894137_06470 [Spirochaetia bacterium]|nr:hypothetical protein FACS1894137_06470 [Spirochaetia bacterium]